MRVRPYILPLRERRRLYRRAYRAQQRDHCEVCGLIVVGADRRLALHFIPNLSVLPYRYEFDLEAARILNRMLEGSGARLFGSFHSHPIGEACPGPGDLRRGFYRGVELIYDVCGCEANAKEGALHCPATAPGAGTSGGNQRNQ